MAKNLRSKIEAAEDLKSRLEKIVEEIGEKLKKKFGEEIEPVHGRLGLFFQSLQRSKSITWV